MNLHVTFFLPLFVTDGIFHLLAAPHNLSEPEGDFLFILVLGLAIHFLFFFAGSENRRVRRVLGSAQAESDTESEPGGPPRLLSLTGDCP